MTLLRSVGAMASMAHRLHRRGRRVGVVLTMGGLHEGHASLIRHAARQTDVVIVTVFVNPLQFGPRDDFARYPRSLPHDLRVARSAGADVVFAPTARELYGRGFHTTVDAGPLARRWEGQARPGHFGGVATVVTLLLLLTRPTDTYVGQKDYQQARILQQLIRDLRLPVRCHIRPTVRAAGGLALSSRNTYLSSAQQERARVLYAALRAGRARIRAGERRAAPILRAMRRMISAEPGVRLDYVAIVDAATLEPQRRIRRRAALLVAARVGGTRLIDNVLVGVS